MGQKGTWNWQIFSVKENTMNTINGFDDFKKHCWVVKDSLIVDVKSDLCKLAKWKSNIYRNQGKKHEVK